MTPADNGRTRSGAPAARGPMVGAAVGVVDVDAVLSGRQRQMGDERGRAALVLSWFRYAVHLLLVLALVLPARAADIAQQQAARADPARRLDVPGHAHVLHDPELHPAGGSHRHQLPRPAPGAVGGARPHEPARLSRFIAAGVAFVGVLIVIRPGGGLHPLGTIFGLITACCFAVHFIATRRVAGDDPFTSLIWSGAVGTLFLTLALPFILPPALPVLRALSATDWALLISTGITGGLGHLFQIAAYRRAPASTLAPFVYLQIVSATSVGWLVWGHFPTR